MKSPDFKGVTGKLRLVKKRRRSSLLNTSLNAVSSSSINTPSPVSRGKQNITSSITYECFVFGMCKSICSKTLIIPIQIISLIIALPTSHTFQYLNSHSLTCSGVRRKFCSRSKTELSLNPCSW